MKVSAIAFFLTSALEVASHPSGHKAFHRSIEKRDTVFVEAVRPAPPPPPAAATPTPTPTPTPAPPAPSAPSSSPAAPAQPAASAAASGGSCGSPKQFCGGNSKRASLADIFAVGNIGAPGNYGCNMMEVPCAQGYDYTATIDNQSGQDQTCVGFLKIGKDGGVNGFFKSNQLMTVTIPPGEKRVIAAEPNSQGGISCNKGKTAQYDQNGQIAGTWLEFDYASQRNKQWSGADISCLVASKAGLPIENMKVCDKSNTCSTIHSDGTGNNAYVAGTNDLDGVGLNIAPNQGPVALQVTLS